MNPTSLTFHGKLKREYVAQFTDRHFIVAFITSLVFLSGAMIIQLFAGAYATERASGFVGDIILSNIPVVNVDMFFVYGPILFWLIISVFCLHRPSKIPFWLKTVSLFILVRSAFITLTHIGPFPDHIAIDFFSISSNINFFLFNSGADLFFSGHTGLPFLSALIFWNNRPMRIFCLLSALFFGVIVLLGHLHYSIDVMSAFFITYTIYNIAVKLFPADKKRFLGDEMTSADILTAVPATVSADTPVQVEEFKNS